MEKSAEVIDCKGVEELPWGKRVCKGLKRKGDAGNEVSKYGESEVMRGRSGCGAWRTRRRIAWGGDLVK
jgi:hypothetical protein